MREIAERFSRDFAGDMAVSEKGFDEFDGVVSGTGVANAITVDERCDGFEEAQNDATLVLHNHVET